VWCDDAYIWCAVTTSSHADMAIIPTKEQERLNEHIGIDSSSAASAMSSKHATQNMAPVSGERERRREGERERGAVSERTQHMPNRLWLRDVRARACMSVSVRMCAHTCTEIS